MKKTCNSCHLELPLNQFDYRALSIDKLQPHCKGCGSRKVKKWKSNKKKQEFEKRLDEIGQLRFLTA